MMVQQPAHGEAKAAKERAKVEAKMPRSHLPSKSILENARIGSFLDNAREVRGAH